MKNEQFQVMFSIFSVFFDGTHQRGEASSFASTSTIVPLMAGTGQYSGQNLAGTGLNHPSYADL